MCGRFALDVHGETVFDSFDWLDRSRSRADLPPSSNVTPASRALVIGKRPGEPATVQPMRWGLSNPSRRPVINARIETLEQRPLFRRAFQQRALQQRASQQGRCLVPASGYYEWFDAGEGKKAYYAVDRAGQLLLMAGLYAKNDDGHFGFVVVTRPALGEAADYHPRMPALVPANDREAWLGEGDPREALLKWTPELSWSQREPLAPARRRSSMPESAQLELTASESTASESGERANKNGDA